MFRNYIILLAVLLFVISCNHAQSQLDNASGLIKKIQINFLQNFFKKLDNSFLSSFKLDIKACVSLFSG